jgi:hypothetical protein
MVGRVTEDSPGFRAGGIGDVAKLYRSWQPSEMMLHEFLDYISEHPGRDARMIGRVLGKTQSNTHHVLKLLTETGRVRKEPGTTGGRGRGARYYPVVRP